MSVDTTSLLENISMRVIILVREHLHTVSGVLFVVGVEGIL
jgi:hypothetical protein